MSSWTTPHRVPHEDLAFAATKVEREHVAMLIRRADWLSRRMKLNPKGAHALDLKEFDAIVWALTRIAGPDVVNKWLGLVDRTPPGATLTEEGTSP